VRSQRRVILQCHGRNHKIVKQVSLNSGKISDTAMMIYVGHIIPAPNKTLISAKKSRTSVGYLIMEIVMNGVQMALMLRAAEIAINSGIHIILWQPKN